MYRSKVLCYYFSKETIRTSDLRLKTLYNIVRKQEI